jgi:plasmid maintenance system killer protein
MDIEFEDSRLSLIETEAAAETRLPVSVIQSARRRLSIMRAAPDAQTLQNWKSLGLTHRAETSDYLIALSPDWAIVVKIIEKKTIMTVIVEAITGTAEYAA